MWEVRAGTTLAAARLKTEMLTPKDEHFVPPVLSGVMFDGRISFDGIATAKNFVVGSYFLTALQSSENPDQNFGS
jgi:hypothetical protein